MKQKYKQAEGIVGPPFLTLSDRLPSGHHHTSEGYIVEVFDNGTVLRLKMGSSVSCYTLVGNDSGLEVPDEMFNTLKGVANGTATVT